MEGKRNDESSENDSLEEGEICDSDQENQPYEKTGNQQWREEIFGQIAALRSLFGVTVKRKYTAIQDLDGTGGSQMHQKKKKSMQSVRYNQALSKKNEICNHRHEGLLEASEWNPFLHEQIVNFGTSEVSANEDSAPRGERSTVRQRAENATKQLQKPSAQSRFITTEESGGKIVNKWQPDSKNNILQLKKDMRNKKPCKFFQEGHCGKGPDCPFYHDSPQEKKREVCKYYLSGHCAKRKLCCYMHEDFPCKFYHTRSGCHSKEHCRFSHKPLTEKTKKLLDKHLQSFYSRGNNYVNEDFDHEKSKPEPESRTCCLLGVPSEHLKQSTGTKLWHEDMNEPEARTRCLLGAPSEQLKQSVRTKLWQEDMNEPEARTRCLLGVPSEQLKQNVGTKLWQENMNKPEPEARRRCLLGAPSEQLKQSVGTKLWQEDMNKPEKKEPEARTRCLLGVPSEQLKQSVGTKLWQENMNKPEPEARRRCLLGVPSEQLKQSVGTKQWREHMNKLLHESKREEFQIQVSPVKMVTPPNKLSPCNSHTGTSSFSSSKRHSPTAEVYNSTLASKAVQSGNGCDWDAIYAMVNKLKPLSDDKSTCGKAPFDENAHCETNSEEKRQLGVTEGTAPLAELEKASFPAVVHQELHSFDSKGFLKQGSEKLMPHTDRSLVLRLNPVLEVTSLIPRLPCRPGGLFTSAEPNQTRSLLKRV